MLDEGSHNTLVTNKLVKELHLEGDNQILQIKGVGELQTSVNSQRITLATETTNSDIVNFTANSVPKICDDI